MSKILQSVLFPRIVPAETKGAAIKVAALGFLLSVLVIAIFLVLIDQVGDSLIVFFFLALVFVYLATGLARASTRSAWLTGVMMLVGVLFGCSATLLIAFYDRASLFPLVAAIYAKILFVPIVVGCLLGVLLGRRSRAVARGASSNPDVDDVSPPTS